jgi:dTDP-4-amino-4,6-dideoxy-D-galactose acyltransferase
MPCVLLEWDSHFFGFAIARVIADQLALDEVGRIDQWCMKNTVRCLYFFTDADDYATAQAVAAGNFMLVDCRMTYQHPAHGPHDGHTARCVPQAHIRPFRPDDFDALCSLAGRCFVDSRFYYDEHFPREQCSRLYQEWIRKSCDADDTLVLVAEREGTLAGFITCQVQGSGRHGNIGLIGVSPHARGTGLGHALLTEAKEYFALQDIDLITVVTQARNIAAQRLYQRCGFTLDSFQLCYHKWYT